MPFTDNLRAITGVLQLTRDSEFLRIKPFFIPGIKNILLLRGKLAKSDSRRVASGEHGRSRRRTHGTGHVEVCKQESFPGHPVQMRRVVDGTSIAPQIAVSKIVAIDKNDIRPVHRFSHMNSKIVAL